MGFMISQRGIEENSEKIEAILNMKAPKTLNELQKLNGRISALGRFISCSAKKCLPLFRALKNFKKIEWNEDCQAAFAEIQKFLTTPRRYSVDQSQMRPYTCIFPLDTSR